MAADDETREDAQEPEASSETAVAEKPPHKMSLNVEIEDSGPCKKHIRVTVPRNDIEHYYDEALGELSTSAQVPGFRVGHAPRKLLERRFRKELSDQVKQNVLMESLEQISEEQELDPINQPNLDIEAIELPEEGDFEYEFDVEVRPDFSLPDYEGLKIKRPVRAVTDEAVENYLEKFLSQYGQLVPYEGAAEIGDYLVMSVVFQHNGEQLRRLQEFTAQLKPVLRLQDAEVENFGELMTGVQADESRETDLTISQEAESIAMRGETVHAKFDVHDVKRLRLPELNKEFFQRIEVDSEEELRQEVRDILERQTRYQQRQAVRSQVLDKITESADWDLPEELVMRQVENARRREILEMQQAGFTTQEIRTRENEIRQRAVSSTRQALKEHFVLDKIANQENIEVTPQDTEIEITMMAMQSGESPRRVRARLEKSGMIENLMAQVRERKAVDLILDRAEFDDVDSGAPEESRIEAVAKSVCGMGGAEQDDESDGESDD